MAKRNRMTALKRQREVKKAEKSALKRERRQTRESVGGGIATKDELEGYGIESDTSSQPAKED